MFEQVFANRVGYFCKVCFGVLFHVLVFIYFILKLVMVPVCVLLPLPSCLFAIGSLVLCVMFSLVLLFIVSCSHWLFMPCDPLCFL